MNLRSDQRSASLPSPQCRLLASPRKLCPQSTWLGSTVPGVGVSLAAMCTCRFADSIHLHAIDTQSSWTHRSPDQFCRSNMWSGWANIRSSSLPHHASKLQRNLGTLPLRLHRACISLRCSPFLDISETKALDCTNQTFQPSRML